MWFDWLSRSKNQVPAAIAQCIADFQPTEMPLPLTQVVQQLEWQDKDHRLTLTLPFAWQSLSAELLPRLLQLDPKLQLELRYQNSLPALFKGIKQVILVASGKGGVGKSTTAVNVAVAMAQEGAKVGLLDADIYGPSIPLMLGLQGQKAESADEKHLLPKQAAGLAVQSIGFLVDPDSATVWRGPMASQALLQLLNETDWGELDYLVVDMPPGTGDIQLTLSQKIPLSGAVIVTTPQDVALADAQKAVAMFNSVRVPVLGLVENMSYYQCKSCGAQDDVFGSQGGLELAQRYQLPVLGQLPLDTQIRQSGDAGVPLVQQAGSGTENYKQIARQLIFALYWRSLQQAAAPEIIFTDD
ncbi:MULTISPECIES: iron-sulfur cluster carrier protein ApbC [Rheinheimera]|uniref:Iron-sulfur cluster carrier protein n=1 Tax=Rheinheimera marina TaxID=1774958 RepID=A0ABV9JQR1_9GAMM